VLLTTNFAVPTILQPYVARDTNAFPAYGYHYPCIDYCLSGLVVSNATLILSNGVAIAAYGANGLTLQTGAKLVSRGSPTNLNLLAPYYVAQEAVSLWGAAFANLLVFPGTALTTYPEVDLRFTELSLIRQTILQPYFLGTFASGPARLALRDCVTVGGYLNLVPQSSGTPPSISVGITNNVFEGSCWILFQGYNGSPAPMPVQLRNNLFQGGSLNLSMNLRNAEWFVHENFFNSNTLTAPLLAVTNSHNAYRSTATLGSSWGRNKTNVVADFQSGPLGRYYYPTTGTNLAALINAGSRGASLAGLYHYTSTADQAKELNSTVDIGAHFVALDSSSKPTDSDGDGLADWIEDYNGNGVVDSQETSFTLADTDGDGLTDYEELVVLQGTVSPLLADTDGNGVSDADEDSDHDLLSNIAELRIYHTHPLDAHSVARQTSADPNSLPLILPAAQPGGYPSDSHLFKAAQVGQPGYILELIYQETANGIVHFSIATDQNTTFDIYVSDSYVRPYHNRLWFKGAPGQREFYVPLPTTGSGFFSAGSAEDSDGDGLTDGFEALVSYTSINFPEPDTDGDGLPDAYELFVTGTDPNVADTGNTGYWDGQKDNDNDGLTNLEEFYRHTDATQPDTIAPQLSPSSGTYTQPQDVTITCSTPAATIRYTLDGSEPIVTTPTTITSGNSVHLSLATATVLKAKAWKAGLAPSPTATGFYSPGVALPVLSPSGGVHPAGQQISISCASPGAIIRYTLDGSEPTGSAQVYTSPIVINAAATIKARAFTSLTQSGTASGYYAIRTAPANDTYVSRRVLTGTAGVTWGSIIGAATEAPNPCDAFGTAASVWFQWTATTATPVVFDTVQSDFFPPSIQIFSDNGSVDCNNLSQAEEYVGSVILHPSVGQRYAILLGNLSTYDPTGNYVLRWYPIGQISRPSLSSPGGVFRTAQIVKVVCDTPFTVLRYSINGVDPTETSAQILSGSSISITKTLNLKVRGWRAGSQPSDIVAASFVIDGNAAAPTQVAATPTAVPADTSFDNSVTVTLNSGTTGATIFYTTDGSEPSDSSASVSAGGGVTLTSSSTLKARSVKAGLNYSSTAIFHFAKNGVDTDFDGVPDSWELAHGSDMFIPDAQHTSTDAFAHGLNNWQVFTHQSILTADGISSAGDGIPDVWKAQYGFSLDDGSLGNMAAINGMSILDSYLQGYNPTDPNSRADLLPYPQVSIHIGPNNDFYVDTQALPPQTTRIRLDIRNEENGSRLATDLPLPTPTNRFLRIPPDRLPGTDSSYTVFLQVQDSLGHVSPVAQSPVFEQLPFIDRTQELRDLMKWRMKFAGGGSIWVPPPVVNDWRFVGLPSWSANPTLSAYEVFPEFFGGQYFPHPAIAQPLYIGDFGNRPFSFDFHALQWVGATYPLADGDMTFSGWDLAETGVQRFSRVVGGLLKYYISCDTPHLNMFGLSITSLRVEFSDRTVTLFPGSEVEISEPNCNETVRVSQIVEDMMTTPVTFVFGYSSLPEAGDVSFYVSAVYPPVTGHNLPEQYSAIENQTITMDVDSETRLYAYSKESIKNSAEETLPQQFCYLQQFFDKAFLCPDVDGDVPRTSQDNIGGKKKIDVPQAVQAGLLSPYGHFAPTVPGKYIVTTKPDADGHYGECVVYAMVSEIVTRNPENGTEAPVEDEVFASTAIPKATLTLQSATINAQGALQLQVGLRVVDYLSQIADDPSERLQTVTIFLNGTALETVDNLPSLSGAGVLPWLPHQLDVTLSKTYSVPNPGGAYILRAETSENAAGNIGWDEVGLFVGFAVAPFAAEAGPVTLAFSQIPTASVADALQIYFGNRSPLPSDPSCAESAPNSLVFTGSISAGGQLRSCTVTIAGSLSVSSMVADKIDADISYQLADGTTRQMTGTFTETGANTLIFVESSSSPTTFTPVVSYTEEREGAPEGYFSPLLARFQSPMVPLSSGRLAAQINEVPQPLKTFTFSPPKIYVVNIGDDDKPKLILLTATDLPPGVNGLKPENLRITEDGDELKFEFVQDGEVVKGTTLQVFKDDLQVKATPGASHGLLTMDNLISYYKLIYQEANGLNLLYYYQQGNHAIEIADVYFRDSKHEQRPGPQAVITIDEAVDPIKGASLLYNELQAAMGWSWVRSSILEDDPDLFMAGVRQAGADARMVGINALNGYMAGLSMVNEGANIVITLDELRQGHWGAAIGIIPFLPAAMTKIKFVNLAGTPLKEFGQSEAFAVRNAMRIVNAGAAEQRALRVRALGKLYDEGKLTAEQLRSTATTMYDKGILKIPKARNYDQLEKALPPKPKGMREARRHHDLPVAKEFEIEFIAAGLEPNDYGRWIPDAVHKKWSTGKGFGRGGPYGAEWRKFLFDASGASKGKTKEEILNYLKELTGENGAFYYRYP
jgi:hypothetical protein